MLAPVVFLERGPEYCEVQYLDDVEGEYYPVGGFVRESSVSLADAVTRWGEIHDLGAVEWEVRDEDWRLEMLGRFDGRG